MRRWEEDLPLGLAALLVVVALAVGWFQFVLSRPPQATPCWRRWEDVDIALIKSYLVDRMELEGPCYATQAACDASAVLAESPGCWNEGQRLDEAGW